MSAFHLLHLHFKNLLKKGECTMFKIKNGQKLIDSAISTFTRIKDQLLDGIELCKNEIANHENTIETATIKKADAEISIKKASKIVVKLEELLSD
jgi:hypothetical protein